MEELSELPESIASLHFELESAAADSVAVPTF
jgi:hypothetical protein